MSMRIIADSCCDLNEKIKKAMNISLIPLIINVKNKVFKDDENLDSVQLRKDMRKSKEVPKTACPSPQDFIEKYKKEGSTFVVTLSSALSGTYKSAVMAKKLFLEKKPDKFIYVFDSLSASVGETMVSLKIDELIKQNMKEKEIVKRVNEYIKDMKTFFILDSLDNLAKAGRLTHVKAKIASILSMKLIMKGTDKGIINVYEKVRGGKKAFKRFVDLIGEEGKDLEDKILGIAHCNCQEKAEKFKAEVLKRYRFKDIIIVNTAGISTIYANEGGLIIAF